MRTLPREKLAAITPRDIFNNLDRFVIGQERAKRSVAIAAYNHFKRLHYADREQSNLLKKSNILMIGPTGCGKTHIARHLASLLEVPFTVVDATEYTEAGYYGKDVEVMIAELLFQTGGDVESTERGIVFIDEIDKIARKSNSMKNGAGNRDIGGEGVQQSLLKMLDGTRLFVPLNVTQHWNRHDFVEVDTSNILFICAGTFSDLRPDFSQAPIGFGEPNGGENGGGKRPRITTQQLVNYGMLAEIMGRLPVVVELDALDKYQLVEVLKSPPDSILREYTELLSLDGVRLQVEEAALFEIAQYAMDQKVGARGLRAILEEILHDVLFEAPEREGTVVNVDPAFVRERLAGFKIDPNV